tara:strand:+ start:557 stop:724 length:168 start_codon:yes stop_codon:yes gene_type:complete
MDKYSIIEALNSIIDGIGYEEISLLDAQHQLKELVEDINESLEDDWDGDFLNDFE